MFSEVWNNDVTTLDQYIIQSFLRLENSLGCAWAVKKQKIQREALVYCCCGGGSRGRVAPHSCVVEAFYFLKNGQISPADDSASSIPKERLKMVQGKQQKPSRQESKCFQNMEVMLHPSRLLTGYERSLLLNVRNIVDIDVKQPIDVRTL